MAAHQAVEQITDLRYTLWMLGIPIDGPSWLFGNNKSIVPSSTILHSTLNKSWNALSYHKVRESIAANIVRFEHIPTGENPADIMTKALPWHKACVHVEPLLFWKGETVIDPQMPNLLPTEGSDKNISDDDLGWAFRIIYPSLYICLHITSLLSYFAMPV